MCINIYFLYKNYDFNTTYVNVGICKVFNHEISVFILIFTSKYL